MEIKIFKSQQIYDAHHHPSQKSNQLLSINKTQEKQKKNMKK